MNVRRCVNLFLPTDDQDPDDPVTFDDGRVQPGDDIPTIKELRPFLGYFNVMHSTASNNSYCDHRLHTHHVKGTTGGQQGEPVPGDHAL